jgi:hypothetical protein
MQKSFDKPIRGISITFNKDDIKKIIENRGMDFAIKSLAGDQFKQSYIKKIIKIVYEK